MATSAVLSSQSLHHHHLKSELPLIPARPKIVKHLKCYNRSDVYKNDNTACKNLPYMCSIEDNTKFLFLPRRSISKSSSLIQSHLTSAASTKTPLKFIEQAPLVTVDSPLHPICKKSSSDPILCSHVSTQKQRCLTCGNTKQYFRKKMYNHAVFSHAEPTLSTLSAKTSPSFSWAKEESYVATTTLNTTSETTDSSRLESSAMTQITSKEKHHGSDGSDCSLGLPLHLFCYKNKRKCYQFKQNTNRRKDEALRIYFIIFLVHHIKLWYRFIAATASPRILNQHSTLTSHQTVTAMIKESDSTSTSATSRKTLRLLPRLGATSFFTLVTIICLETILLSTMSTCAKTFYMHWNTSNSIFRIDNTDHIIDVNKGNLAFEFDQVHIICPVYEPGTFDNETEKYIIYNVSKVEYETCRITNADPRVIAICDKPQKLMFFTITFRPFTPQPGGLEFLPGNDYYFISTSSKDDLYRRIGGRCSTNNMKVVFKVCCAPEEKNKTSTSPQMIGGNKNNGGSPGVSVQQVAPTDIGTTSVEDPNGLTNVKNLHAPHNNINVIGVNGMNSGVMPNGVLNINTGGTNNNGMQVNPVVNSPSSTSINTNVDQFNRIPIQTNNLNVLGNNIGANNVGLGSHGSGIILTHGNSGVNMIPTGGIGVIGQYPSHGYHGQSGIRINNVPSSHHINHKNSNDDHYEKHPNEVVKNEELTYNSGASNMVSRIFFIDWTTEILKAILSSKSIDTTAIALHFITQLQESVHCCIDQVSAIYFKSFILYSMSPICKLAVTFFVVFKALRYVFLLKPMPLLRKYPKLKSNGPTNGSSIASYRLPQKNSSINHTKLADRR
ncbi:ephrin isoform 3-T6 [Glossina fuscipes fuscipes]